MQQVEQQPLQQSLPEKATLCTKQFGEDVKKWRLERGLNRRQLANMVDWEYSSLKSLELGELGPKEIPGDVVKKLEEVFEVSWSNYWTVHPWWGQR